MARKHKVTKEHERGMLQALVAVPMVKYRVNKNTKPETKTKAVIEAQKALGDEEPGRARQIMNWMLNHEYVPSKVAARLKAKTTARKAPAKRAAHKKPAAQEEQVAA